MNEKTCTQNGTMKPACSLWPSVVVTLVAFGIMITVNALANSLPLNGVNTGQLSNELPNLFVPAGVTFGIWGLIYLLLAGKMWLLLESAIRGRQVPSPLAIWILAVNFLLNAAWIFAWHWRLLPLSVLLTLGILGSLIAIGELHRRADPEVFADPVRRFLWKQPVQVYLGWMCVATVANITVLLVHRGFDGGGLDPRIWTVLVIAVATGLGVALIVRRGTMSPALVIIWALLGIILKRTLTDASHTFVIIVAAALGATLLLFMVAKSTHDDSKSAD